MKKSAILLVVVMMILGALATAKASWMDVNQRYYFAYANGSAYYGFIYDYSLGYQESNTGGFISYSAYLTYVAQGPGSGYTTHVAYVYDSVSGRYVEAMATLDHML